MSRAQGTQLIEMLGGRAASCTERMLSLGSTAMRALCCAPDVKSKMMLYATVQSRQHSFLCKALLFMKQHAPYMAAYACCAGLISGERSSISVEA